MKKICFIGFMLLICISGFSQKVNMNVQVVDNNSGITVNSKTAGHFVPAPYPNKIISADNPVVFKDEADNIIAQVTKGNSLEIIIDTYDRNTFKMESLTLYDPKNPSLFYKTVVEFLALKEYLNGQANSFLVKKAEYTQKRKEADEAQITDLRARTEVEENL